MKIAIIFKKDKVKDKNVVPKLVKEFEKRGHEVNLLYSAAELKGNQMAIVLGGDGALLHTAVIAAPLGVPVMGVNFGTVGFLSELEAKEVDKVPDLVLGEHKILNRSMLKIELDGKAYYALNECVLQRDYSKSYSNQVAEVGVVVNGRKMQDYVLDGLAIATPTGSTAYSLSAGGSILAPQTKAFIVTPICPMSLFARPTILPDDTVFTFDLEKQKDDMRLYADGRSIGVVNEHSKLSVEKAPFEAAFITRDSMRLFSVLHKKLLR